MAELACRAVARRLQRDGPPALFELWRGSLRPRRRSGRRLVEPEVVATSPYPIKSRVPVCCGFSSTKMVGERGLAPPRFTDARSVGSAIPSEPLARKLVLSAGTIQTQNAECGVQNDFAAQAYLPGRGGILHSPLPTPHLKEPPAGAAPAQLAYKESPRAAARRHRDGLPS